MPARRRQLRTWLAAACAPVLQACSPLTLINALTPHHTHRVAKDLAYGPAPRQQLDLYLPVDAAPRAPMAVFFYGGSWNSGARADYRFVGEALASRGVITAVADYRLNPEVRYPTFLEDCARAVHWALDQAPAWGAQDVYVMGHSAGAYNAAMLALDPRWLQPLGRSPEALAGWIGLAGPYDFLPIGIPEVQEAFGWPHTPEDSQPLFHASRRGSPRALLLAAKDDLLVSPERNTQQLAQALRRQGTPVEVAVFERLSHASLIGAMARPLRSWGPVLDTVSAFMLSPTARS